MENFSPALEVYRGKIATIDYYRDETKGTPNAYLILEELILTWLLNQNPAAKPYQELFTDHFLIKKHRLFTTNLFGYGIFQRTATFWCR